MSPSTAAAPRATATNPRATTQTGAPARRPVGPRRVSGPARPAHPAYPARTSEPARRPALARPPSSAPFTQHVTRLVDHSLLDRLIRGRAWIGLVAFALIGIVAMQVTLLRLNAGIGRSIQRVTALQRESSQLAAEVAGLSAPQRIQAEATALGMVYAPPADVRYLHVTQGDAARAATAFVAPSSGPTGAAGATGLASSNGATSSSTPSSNPASTSSSTSTSVSASPSTSTSTVAAASPSASPSTAAAASPSVAASTSAS